MEPPTVPDPVDQLPEEPRAVPPDVPLYQGIFAIPGYKPAVPPREDHATSRDPRNTSMSSTSTRGETTLVRKFILRRITELNKITSQVVNNNTCLEKAKSLQTRTFPG